MIPPNLCGRKSLMKHPSQKQIFWAVTGTFVSVSLASAQPVLVMEAPKPFEVRIERPRLTLEAEGNREQNRLGDAPASTEDITDLTPAFGMQLNGSIYNRRLLDFSIETENGFTQGKRRTDDGQGNVVTDDRQFTLERYHATATLLGEKPYPVTFFATRDREHRNYDQFNRFDAQTQDYGASARGSSSHFDWNIRLSHNDEQIDNPQRPSSYRSDLLDVNGEYRRNEKGQTTFRFSDEDFNRQDGGDPAYSGIQRSFYIFDQSNIDTNQNDRLLSSLNLNDLSESIQDYQSLTWREDIRNEVRPNLWDGALYQYDRRESRGTINNLHNGEVYAEHRYKESLDSHLDLQGELGDGEGDNYTRYGPGVTERYTKKMSDDARLGITLEGRVDQIRQTLNGSSVMVVGELLRLDDQRPVFLALPHVQPGTVVVTGANGAQRYLEGFDYRAIPRGAYMEIQRVFGGAIPNGSTVKVDYVADAGGSVSQTRMSSRSAVELDLYDRLLFLYADQRTTDSSGGQTLAYENYRDTVLGIKNRWSWLELGAEHMDHTGESLGYSGMTYYADLFWDGESTSAKLHAGRSILNYLYQEGRLDTRTYTATVGWNPVGALNLQGFAGEYKEENPDGERNLLTLECRLLFRFSRLSLDGTFRYENEAFASNHYERQYFLVRLTRDL
ncbi:MAG: hypothetical protein WCO42_06995 [bacterium]